MPSQEGVQTTLGEPGAVVPENPQDIAAFKEVRNVDAKELNAQIKKEEEAEKVATVAADAEPAEPAKPKYVKKVKKLVPKAEAEAKESDSTAAATSKPAPGSSTSSGSTAAKKEKKGIFSRIKKALQ
jgi:hypothetical protein